MTTSFNLIRRIRARRLRWLGHILRAGPGHLTFQALKTQLRLDHQGNLLSDAPPHTTVEELVPLAMDRAGWQQLVRLVPASY